MSWPSEYEVAVIFNIDGAGDRMQAAIKAADEDMARRFGKDWNKVVPTKPQPNHRGWWRKRSRST